MNKWTVEWMTKQWVDEQLDNWMNGWMDRWMNDKIKWIYLNKCVNNEQVNKLF